VLRHKPIRQVGQDIRTLPTYTIPEAAVFLAISQRKLFDWYEGQNPVLKPSGYYNKIALLSFRDLEEAYKVHLLRSKERLSLQYLRRAMTHARKEYGSEHPLIDRDIRVLDMLVMSIPGSGRRPRRAVPLGSPGTATYIPEVVRVWAQRIVSKRDRTQIFPWRFFNTDEQSRPVSLDPEVMSGRLVVTGTRIPVDILRRRRLSGETPRQLAHDYGIGVDLVQKALLHIGSKKAA
jgi:uncharacterized protein (DUF433 family)